LLFLQSGAIDILSRSSTLTMTREAERKLIFPAVTSDPLRVHLDCKITPPAAIMVSLSTEFSAKDAMRRTKAASVFLHSPSSHRDVRRLANV
jgi:hypothetical protein